MRTFGWGVWFYWWVYGRTKRMYRGWLLARDFIKHIFLLSCPSLIQQQEKSLSDFKSSPLGSQSSFLKIWSFFCIPSYFKCLNSWVCFHSISVLNWFIEKTRGCVTQTFLDFLKLCRHPKPLSAFAAFNHHLLQFWTWSFTTLFSFYRVFLWDHMDWHGLWKIKADYQNLWFWTPR